MEISLEVVFENENFIVINKPTNLSTQNNNHYDVSIEKILKDFGEPYSLLKRSGIVHRIDRNTTGLLIVAKNSDYQNFLIEIFKSKKIEKKYLSLNSGKTKNRSGLIKFFLKKKFNRKSKIRMVHGNFEDKLVELSFEKICEGKTLTLLKTQALTGKTHQIRLAFESINLPIYNDDIYNLGISKKNLSEEGHYLHSYYLSFFEGSRKFEFFSKMPLFFLKKISEEGMKFEEKKLFP